MNSQRSKFKATIQIVILLVLTFCAGTQNGFAQTADELVTRARVSIDKADSQKAIEDLNRAIKLDDNNSLAHSGLGRVYYFQSQNDRALAELNRAITLDARNYEAYNYRAVIYYIQRKYDEAFADANQAISINPQYGRAYFSRGLVYYARQNRDVPAALNDFSKTIELRDPETTDDAYRLRAGIHNNVDKDYAAARRDATESIKINSGYGWTYYERGYANTNLRINEDAEKDYIEALRLGVTGEVNLYINLSYVSNRLNKFRQGRVAAQKALALEPNNQNAKANLADAEQLDRDDRRDINNWSKYTVSAYLYDAPASFGALKIVSDAVLFDPPREAIGRRDSLEISEPFTQAGLSINFAKFYTYQPPRNYAFYLLADLYSPTSGFTATVDLRDPGSSLTEGIKPYYTHSDPIEFRFKVASASSSPYKLAAGLTKVGGADVRTCALPPKYLVYHDDWDLMTKLLFLSGHSSCRYQLLSEVRDELGQPFEKSKNVVNTDFESLQLRAARFTSREEAFKAYEAIWANVYRRLDQFSYEVLETNTPVNPNSRGIRITTRNQSGTSGFGIQLYVRQDADGWVLILS